MTPILCDGGDGNLEQLQKLSESGCTVYHQLTLTHIHSEYHRFLTTMIIQAI